MFEKMEDVELVLRFFAYRQIGVFKAGLNKISEFLDKFLVEGNNFNPALLDSYKNMFESTVRFLWETLGPDSYCVIGASQRPTKIVYDPIMFVANSPEVNSNYEILTENKEILKAN